MKILSARYFNHGRRKAVTNPEITINQVSTDTRTLRKGALFIAIKVTGLMGMITLNRLL